MKQLLDMRNVRRLARRLHPGESWSGRYSENFVQVPEREWRRVSRPRIVRAGRPARYSSRRLAARRR